MKIINKYLVVAFAIISLFLSSCGGTSSYSGGTSHRSVNHYHHGYGNSGWGNPYYGNDVIIIDNGPDIIDEIEMGMPEAVDLPMDDW